MPGQEIDGLLLVFGHADEGVGQLLLGRRGDPRLLLAALQDGCVRSGDAVLPGDPRLLLRVHELYRELGGVSPVAVDEVAILQPDRTLVVAEHSDLDFPGQLSEQTGRLRSKGESLRLGKIPADAVARGQKGEDPEDCPYQNDN